MQCIVLIWPFETVEMVGTSFIDMNRELTQPIASLSKAQRKIEEKKGMEKSLCQHMDVGTIQRENWRPNVNLGPGRPPSLDSCSLKTERTTLTDVPPKYYNTIKDAKIALKVLY